MLTNGQTMITGNYFEANGNDVGAMSAWETTIDTAFFWGSYGHGRLYLSTQDGAVLSLCGSDSPAQAGLGKIGGEKGLERLQAGANVQGEPGER